MTQNRGVVVRSLTQLGNRIFIPSERLAMKVNMDIHKEKEKRESRESREVSPTVKPEKGRITVRRRKSSSRTWSSYNRSSSELKGGITIATGVSR